MSEIIILTDSADEEREKSSGGDEGAEKKAKAASDEERKREEMSKAKRETVAVCNWNVERIMRGNGSDARDVTAAVLKMLKKRKIIHRWSSLKTYKAALAHCINAKPTKAVGHRLYREGPLQLEGMSCLPTTEYDYRILQAAKFFRINVTTLNSMLIELEPRARTKNQPPVLARAMPIEVESYDTDIESTVGIQNSMAKIELPIETDGEGEEGDKTADMPTIAHFDRSAETTDNEEEDEVEWSEPMDVVTTFEGDYIDKTKSRSERIRSFVNQVFYHLEDAVDRECVDWMIKCMIDYHAFADVPSIFHKNKVLQYFKVLLPSLYLSDFRPEAKRFASIVPNRVIKIKRQLTILERDWDTGVNSSDDEEEHELLKVHKRITEEREKEKEEREKRWAEGIYTSDESSSDDEDEEGGDDDGMENGEEKEGGEEEEGRDSSRGDSESTERGKEDTSTDPSSEDRGQSEGDDEIEEIEENESADEETIASEGSECIEHVEVDGIIVMDDEDVIIDKIEEGEGEGRVEGEGEGVDGEGEIEWIEEDFEVIVPVPLIHPMPAIPPEDEQEVYAREMEEREESVEGEGRALVKLEVKDEPVEANGEEVIFAGSRRVESTADSSADSNDHDSHGSGSEESSVCNFDAEVDVVGVEEEDEVVPVRIVQRRSPRRVSPLVHAPTPKEPEKKKRKMSEEKENEDEEVVFVPPRRSQRCTSKPKFPPTILPPTKKDDDEIEVIEPVVEVKREVVEVEEEKPRRSTRGLPRQTTPAAKKEDKKVKATTEEIMELVQGRGDNGSKPSTPDQSMDKRRRGTKTDDEDEVVEVPPPRRTPRLRQMEVKKEMEGEEEDEDVQYVSTRRGRSKAKTPAKGKAVEEKQKMDLSKALMEMGRDLKGSRPSTPDQPIVKRMGGDTGKKETDEDKEVEILSPQKGRGRPRGKTPAKKVEDKKGEDKKTEEKKDEDDVQILPTQPKGRGRPARGKTPAKRGEEKVQMSNEEMMLDINRGFNGSKPSTPDEARNERKSRRDEGKKNEDDDVVEVVVPVPRRTSLPRGKSPAVKKATSPVAAKGKRNQAMRDAEMVLALSKDFNGSKPSTPEPGKRPAVKKEMIDEDEVMVVASSQKGRGGGGRQPRGRTPARKAEEKKPAMNNEEMMLMLNKGFAGSKPSTPDQLVTKAPRGTGRKTTVKKEEVEMDDGDVECIAVRRSSRITQATPMEKEEPKKIVRGKSPAVQMRKTPAKPLEVKEEEPKRATRGRSTARGKSPHPSLSSQPSTSKRGMK